eukprot:TRINITY_DN3275_c0_g1_i2.p1 TRINITY_DN3275_c0_g1~~TRINITY_DN3275_c0_g1_i2.p1  ORF type:complete len:242 (+),score=15.07 TRINITY_DN3275_c0_g1_i2:324-1049(+)
MEVIDLYKIYSKARTPGDNSLPLQEKQFVGLKFQDAFSGYELLDWMISTFSLSKTVAKSFATQLLDNKLISHCSSDKLPFTKQCFYQFVGSKSTYHVPLVTIHGIKGSNLYNARSKKTDYLTFQQATGIQTTDISLPLTWEPKTNKDGNTIMVQNSDTLVPQGLLEKVKVGDLGEDIYAPWMKISKTLGRVQVKEFAYDWRRNLFEAVDNFIEFLSDLNKETGQKIQVVAHSMGGLVTLVH